MEDTPRLRTKLKELQSQVNPYTPGGATFSFDILASSKIYLYLPIAVLVLLLLFRPSFVYIEDKEGKRKLAWSKVLLFWIVITGAISLGIFGYNYREKTN